MPASLAAAPQPSPPAKMSSMHWSAGSSPAWAAQEAASVRRYMSCSLPISRVLVDMEGMWPRSSGSVCSAVMMPAMPPKTGAVLREGLGFVSAGGSGRFGEKRTR